ncbi:MAG: glycosyltransferase family 4 protein [Deltaproteobacteria bacterium]|nr:glycosyltransferase family 4 protein [Deltaproteobacteria bacterium]
MSSEWEIFKLQIVVLGGLLFLSLAVSWVILYYVRLLDHPNERSSHDLAIPKCGGVGIVVSFVAGVYLSQLWGGQCIVSPGVLYAFIIPVLLIASISLADDIHELSPYLRLGVQICAALLFLFLIKFAGGASDGSLLSIVVLLLTWLGAIIWIVGMSNTFNFMDGIDGLAAGQGLIVSFFFAMIQLGQGNCFLGFIALVLMGGCLGFLAFNFPPAKVFMGDVGSVSIGFILAIMALLSFNSDPSAKTLLIMPLLMSNFLFDTVTTFLRRLIKGEAVFQSHRTHLYQKFAARGFSQRTQTMTNYVMAIIQGMVILLVGEKIMYGVASCIVLQLVYSSFVMRYYKK